MSEAPLGILNPMTWLAATTWTTGSPAEFALNIALFVGALAGLLIGVGLTMRKRPPKGLSMLSDSAMTNQQPGTARRAKV
jgi:hypothetical protein